MSEITTSTTSLPSLPTTTTSPTSVSTSTSSSSTTTTRSTSSETSTTPTTSSTSTTSSTTSSSTSTAPTTSSSTTSTTSSTSSSTEATTSSATSSSSTTTSPTSLSTLTSTGDDQTSTVVVTATGTGASTSQTAVSDSTSGGKSFFDNKGAVAGVFTVVGLVALVLFVVVATNVIRRRRAKKFDEEVAAAAAEANASTRYPFDDYDDPAPGGGYSTYSDPESHGTLSQAPLTHTGESYNMSEFNGGYGPSYATGTTTAGAGAGVGAGAGAGLSAGAAGIGASRSLARRSTNPNGDYTAPYNAFAGPLEGYPSDPYDPYTAGNIGIRRQGSRSGAELLDAVGIGAAGATGATTLNRGPSQNTQNPAQSLDRNQSQTTQHSGGNANSGGTTQESYAAHYQPDFRPDEHQYQRPLAAAPPSAGDALPNPFAREGASDEDAYGGEIRSSSPHDETRMSIRDEEDYGRAGRTLKVANE